MGRSLSAIQADLDEAYSARLAAMKATEYETGNADKIRLKRDLDGINKTIEMLEAEYGRASGGNRVLIGRGAWR